jgi:hypothetical protein
VTNQAKPVATDEQASIARFADLQPSAAERSVVVVATAPKFP